MLYNICQSYVNRQEMQETVVMLQEWFEDMSQVDAMARWDFDVMRELYGFTSSQ